MTFLVPDPFDIPPDATVAEQHAPPVNLNGTLPEEPTPSAKASPDSARQEGTASPKADAASASYSSPEPVEAMFAQLRDDMKAQQRLLMLTATTVIFLSLLFAYTVKNGGLLDGSI